MMAAAAFVLSYLIGSVPTGFLLVKWLKRMDVRTVGSGNMGATNVARAAGRSASLAVFVMDAAKGLVPVLVIAPWLLDSPAPAQRLACGLAAVLGHDFPVWLRFKGGKGVATTIGVVMAMMPSAAAAIGLVWALTFAVWRYASVSSMAAAAAIPIVQRLAHRSGLELALGILLAALIIVRHRANIARLLAGQEHHVGSSR